MKINVLVQATEVEVDQLVLLRGGPRDGDYVIPYNAGQRWYAVSRYRGRSNPEHMPIREGVEYERSADFDSHGVRIYDFVNQ